MGGTCYSLDGELFAVFVLIVCLAVFVRMLFSGTSRPGASELKPVRPPTPKPLTPRRRCPSKGMGEPIPCCECDRANCDIRKR